MAKDIEQIQQRSQDCVDNIDAIHGSTRLLTQTSNSLQDALSGFQG